MSERHIERNLEAIMRKCRYFTGVQNKVCEAGVNYDDVVPIPCVGRIGAEVEPAKCEKKSCYTREEAIQIDKERGESTKRFISEAIKEIQRLQAKEPTTGVGAEQRAEKGKPRPAPLAEKGSK